MFFESKKMSVYIITPSKISTSPSKQVLDSDRLAYATASMASLRHRIGGLFPHIVVDDSETDVYARAIYGDCIFIQGQDKGMLAATIDALEEAKARGANAVFLHLDDMYYVEGAKELCEYAAMAMAERDSLHVVHLSNFPLIENRCLTDRGNQTFLNIGENSVAFDQVVLSPLRGPDHTLWVCNFKSNMVTGEFWPLALWFAFYRIEFLEKILKYVMAGRPGTTTLGEAEVFLREKPSWDYVVHTYPGEIGYINMQFGGFEMHRNKNFLEVIRIPNRKVT